MNPIPQAASSARQDAKDAFSRLKALDKRVTDQEETTKRVLMATNQIFGQLSQAVDSQAETVEALVTLTGAEAVAQQIAEIRATKLRQQAERTKAEIEKLVSEKKFAAATEVTGEKSLIVGKETQKDGTEVPPGWAAVRFVQLKPEYQEKLKGKKVGDSVETESGGKFTVLELYESTPQPESAAAPNEGMQVAPAQEPAAPAPVAEAPPAEPAKPAAEAAPAQAQA